MDLKQYERKKFAIAEIIRSIQAVDTQDGTLTSECRGLLARLAEDRFNLLVVGRFSRGKSTLMNAVLDDDHLPTGIIPLTSVITTVRYGSRKQAVLHFTDSGLSREVPLSQLANYVTQKENPGNVKKLAYAEIELPVEILRRGFFFIDTPGLGSPIVENTLTTERFLPQADAFVLVTSYESPLSEEEDRILHRIRNVNKKLFVVLNKQDTVGLEEQKEALSFVTERLQQFSFSGDARIFSMSARQGLEAKQNQNPEQLESSGLQAFEAALLRFLTEERAQSFLANMYERTMTLLIQQSTSNGRAEDQKSYQALVERLRDVRGMILDVPDQPNKSPALEPNTDDDSYTLQIDKRIGCGICGAILEAVFRFLSKYQYELTINPETQESHARSGGFCPLHTWQYEGISSPYGVCTAYPELAHRLASELRNYASHATQQDGSLENIRRLLPTTKTCRICLVRIETEARAVQQVAEAAQAAASIEPHVPACCFPHLVMVTEALGSGEPAEMLLKAHANLLERTAEDLQRYAIKHDALRRYLTSEEERRASQLALLLLAGHRNVSAPWVIESII